MPTFSSMLEPKQENGAAAGNSVPLGKVRRPKPRRPRSPGHRASRHQCFEIRDSPLTKAAALGKRTEADACRDLSHDCTHQKRNPAENASPAIVQSNVLADCPKPVYAPRYRREFPTNARRDQESDQTGTGNSAAG